MLGCDSSCLFSTKELRNFDTFVAIPQIFELMNASFSS
jgi:hypothetical protein